MTSPRHPYRLTSTHAWADADLERHIADVVRLVLLTGPGERLHRREFGAGLGSAVFEPLDPASLVFTEARAAARSPPTWATASKSCRLSSQSATTRR